MQRFSTRSPYFFLLTMLCFAAIQPVQAQHRSRTHTSYGIVAGPALNIHSADFSALPGIDNCCNNFTGGTGFGYGAGITYYAPIREQYGLQFVLAYQNMSADLIEEENIGPVVTPRGLEDGIVEHRLFSSTHALEFRPSMYYSISQSVPLDMYIGPHIAYMLTNKVHQEEAFVSPSDKTFTDGSTIRNQYDLASGDGYGEMPDANNISFGISAGFQTRFYLNEKWWLLPELSVGLGIQSLSSGITWVPNFARLSVGLLFTPPEPPVPPPPPPPPPPPALNIGLQIAAKAEDGTTLPEFKIVVEEVSKSELFPLLPFVFFAQGSSELDPRRMHLLTAAQTRSFNESSLPNNTLDIYKDLLNIIGVRLRNNPRAVITLTGCNNMTGEETNNRELSKQRAIAVQQYMVTVWGIDANRVHVDSRNYPAQAPDKNSIEGKQEARRVEIASTNYEVIKPILWQEIERDVRTPNVMITPKVEAESGIHAWSVKVTGNNIEYAAFQGMDATPGVLKWTLDTTNAPEPGTKVDVTFELWDNAGQSRVKTLQLPVDQEILTREVIEERGGKRIDRFSLILFEFKKSEIGQENQKILDIVRNAIKSNSRVTIYGFTDRTGSAEYNRKLALDRCQSVETALRESLEGIPTKLEAVGSDRLLYDNDNPEGRNFCRTVQIVVETGIE